MCQHFIFYYIIGWYFILLNNKKNLILEFYFIYSFKHCKARRSWTDDNKLFV